MLIACGAERQHLQEVTCYNETAHLYLISFPMPSNECNYHPNTFLNSCRLHDTSYCPRLLFLIKFTRFEFTLLYSIWQRHLSRALYSLHQQHILMLVKTGQGLRNIVSSSRTASWHGGNTTGNLGDAKRRRIARRMRLFPVSHVDQSDTDQSRASHAKDGG